VVRSLTVITCNWNGIHCTERDTMEDLEGKCDGENEDENFAEEGKDQHENLMKNEVVNDNNESQKPQQSKDRVNWLVQLLFARGEFQECLRLVDAQIKACTGLCEYPLHVKGLIKRQHGEINEALELFRAAAVLNPSNQENLLQIGKCLFLLGRSSAAIDVLDEAATIATDEDWRIQHNKGMCFVYLKDYERAIDCFRLANDIQRHDETFMEQGRAYAGLGKHEAAIDMFLEALEFSPENPVLLTTVGLLYLRIEENFKAFDYLGNSLTYDPRNPKTILAAGSVIQDHGDMDVALVKYRVAAVKTPNSAQLWNNIGMCFFGKQKYVAAIACLKRSLYLDPFQWITAHNLGLAHMHTNQNASAFHYLSASVNLKADYASSYMYLAIVLGRLGDEESAITAYEKSIELNPNDPICFLNFAVTLHNLGQRERSRSQYLKYSAIYSCLSTEERNTLLEAVGTLHENCTQVYA